MSLLLANWKLVLLGLLIASTALFYKLWRGEVESFAIFKAQVEVMGKAAEAEKVRVEADHNKLTKEIKDAIPKQIAAARANAMRNYVARMPVDAGSGSVSRPADHSGGTDAAGKEPVVTCTERFIEDSADDALKIDQFQQWARAMQFPVK